MVPIMQFAHFPLPERPIETHADKLRSILSQLEYSHQVVKYDEAGVPFRMFMYVPEVHPITGNEYHEREDDAHVLKVIRTTSKINYKDLFFVTQRIANSNRHGGPAALKLERFAEALEDLESLLTYPALMGQRKQSVRDAERLLSKENSVYDEERLCV